MHSGIRYDDQKMSRLMDVLGAAPCQKMEGFTAVARKVEDKRVVLGV